MREEKRYDRYRRHGNIIVIGGKFIIGNIIIDGHVGPPLENGTIIHTGLLLFGSQLVDSGNSIVSDR